MTSKNIFLLKIKVNFICNPDDAIDYIKRILKQLKFSGTLINIKLPDLVSFFKEEYNIQDYTYKIYNLESKLKKIDDRIYLSI